MLIDAADVDRSDRSLMNWWGNGGEQTLDSYGVNDPMSLPLAHLEWLKSLPLGVVSRRGKVRISKTQLFKDRN